MLRHFGQVRECVGLCTHDAVTSRAPPRIPAVNAVRNSGWIRARTGSAHASRYARDAAQVLGVGLWGVAVVDRLTGSSFLRFAFRYEGLERVLLNGVLRESG